MNVMLIVNLTIRNQYTFIFEGEDCNFNYNSAYIAYLGSVSTPTNPMDTLTLYWTFIDTTGMMSTVVSYAGPVNASGCYNFTLILYCSIKSTNIKTIIVNHSYDVSFVGIKELTGNNKQLVSVTDLLGRDVKIQTNKMLIYTYSDGSREIKYINE